MKLTTRGLSACRDLLEACCYQPTEWQNVGRMSRAVEVGQEYQGQGKGPRAMVTGSQEDENADQH